MKVAVRLGRKAGHHARPPPGIEIGADDVADEVLPGFADWGVGCGHQRNILVRAGVAGPIAKLWEHTPEQWDQVIRINLTGQFNCCKALVPGMIERNYGRIANIASIAGKEGNPNASAYSASKAGVIGLTKSLGKELATYDIAVNAITPAAARTAILDTVSQSHIDYMLSKIPRGRLVLVEEIAATIAFMVSQECSFTTGFTFDISGGRATY
ncbi:MAG: SDR family oxidoreductase [Bauldia sp.]|nr:MAG: SDR family oxidoreductase [Bauldia sp.]